MTLCAWHLSDLWPGWLGPREEHQTTMTQKLRTRRKQLVFGRNESSLRHIKLSLCVSQFPVCG